MKTRIADMAGLGFSFQYAEEKHPLPHQWHRVGGNANPASWPSAWKRDQARACFTNRRSVEAAMADLTRLRLPTTPQPQGSQ